MGDADAMLTSLQTFCRDYFDHCTDAQSAARRLDRDIQRESFAASTRADGFRSQLESLSSNPTNMSMVLKHHASKEPDTGICDAILVTPISKPLGDEPNTSEVAEFLKDFGLVQHVVKDKKAQGDVPSQSSSYLLPPTSARPESQTEQLTKEEEHQLLDNPLRAVRSESSSASTFRMPHISVIDSTALLLPQLIAEHKKRDEHETKALNQERTYIVSAARFLATIGIKGHPIFGLVTSGKIGGVIMAWHSESLDVCALAHLVYGSIS